MSRQRSVMLPHTRVIDVNARSAGTDFQIWIAEPVEGMMPFPDGPRDVLYVLDANLFFGTAVEMTRLMSQLYGELPPLLVVGIAYPTASPREQAALRARDLTPSAPRDWPPAPMDREEKPTSSQLGEAADFLDFLTEEVRPFIEAEYDVAGARSTLFGSSLGGLFTLYAMTRQPEAFDAWIAVSPALWWDEGMLLEELDTFLQSREDLDTRVFLAAGGNEEHPAIPGLARFRMISNVRLASEMLHARSFPSLALETFVPDGESHTSVVPVALTRGLRFVYARSPRTPGPPSSR